MTDIDPLAAMHRANQAFHEQLLETAALTCGVAYFSAAYGQIANQIRDVMLPAGMTIEQAYAEVQSFFAKLPHPCRSWSPALGEDSGPFEQFLPTQGYAARRKITMALRPWPDLPPRPAMRVVPGRAVRQDLSTLLLNDPARGTARVRELSTDMFLSRMDDPRLDVLVGMSGDRPIAHVCLMQVGPIAAVYDLYVQEAYRRQGCGLALMYDVVTTCRRLELRTVVLEVGKSNTDALRLYERCGFEQVGTGLDFLVRPENPS